MLGLLVVLIAAVLPGPAVQPDPVALLLDRLQEAGRTEDAAAVQALASDGVDIDALARSLTAPADRIVVQERDRLAVDGERLRLLIEVFVEHGVEGRLVTWSLDVVPGASTADLPRITGAVRLTSIPGLYRLALDSSREFSVHNLTLRAPDLSLEMSSGSAFVAETPEGPTAIVLVGRGRMHFAPEDPAERTQVRIFAGGDAVSTEFDAAFIRLRPSQFSRAIQASTLRPRTVNPQTLRRALAVFDENVGRTLQIDLSDLSRDRWSLLPQGRDIIAEVRTRRFGLLTYTRTFSDAEDVALFDRRRRRTIAIYASAEKLKTRGRFYSEDDLVDYDVLHYDLDVAITPDRGWIEGTARLKVKIRGRSVSTLNLRLAETLQVRRVSSAEFGRLLHLRVVGQSVLIVNLPGTVVEGSEFWVTVTYAGRVQPQTLEREVIAMRQDIRETIIPLEPHYLYSNRSYWYPQSLVTDYASATLRISVPSGLDVVATGQPTGPPVPPSPDDGASRGRHVFVFEADEPVRYLACVISRFNALEPRKVPVTGNDAATVSVYVHANPRQAGRARGMAADAADMLEFFSSVAGGAPYPSLSLAVAESDRPGGHSPPYFALVHQVVPTSELVWRSDPVSFDSFPLFFLAHEVAHQWWGHAVGWKNYHEQWISEGFAQYFAALYAERQRGEAVFGTVRRQMRQTAIASSAQGPIYLGYRLGHIRGDDRVFRAVIYNKGAMVLHMLRRLIGDEAFFSGLRTFYQEWTFQKAGTDDFRQVMERASGRELSRFFETWVYGAAIPQVSFRSNVKGSQAELRFEVREAVDVAIAVTITYVSGRSEDVLVQLSEKVTVVTVPLAERAKAIVANADHAALVTIGR
ncbi:hypothetical protein BH23ACI1_BH23ACI1_11000 [soil metagenome]